MIAMERIEFEHDVLRELRERFRISQYKIIRSDRILRKDYIPTIV